jgi:hypothetical protein
LLEENTDNDNDDIVDDDTKVDDLLIGTSMAAAKNDANKTLAKGSLFCFFCIK